MSADLTLGGTQRYSAFIDLDEAKDWVRFPTVPSETARLERNLKRIIEMTCSHIQAELARPVGPQTFTERHDGWSGEYILLKESPFLKLIYCREWQSSGGMIDLPESTPESPTEGIQINYGTSRIMRTFAGYSWPRPFFPGSRNIEVCYVAGYNPLPPDIVMATLELIGHWWRNTQQVYRDPRQAVDPNDAAATQGGLWQGVPNRIVSLLAPYRKIGIG